MHRQLPKWAIIGNYRLGNEQGRHSSGGHGSGEIHTHMYHLPGGLLVVSNLQFKVFGGYGNGEADTP